MTDLPLIKTPLFSSRRVSYPALAPLVARAAELMKNPDSPVAVQIFHVREKHESDRFIPGEASVFLTEETPGAEVISQDKPCKIAVALADFAEKNLSSFGENVEGDFQLFVPENYHEIQIWVTPYGAWVSSHLTHEIEVGMDLDDEVRRDMDMLPETPPDLRIFRRTLGSDPGDHFARERRGDITQYAAVLPEDHERAVEGLRWVLPQESNHSRITDLAHEEDVAPIGWAIIAHACPVISARLLDQVKKAVKGEQDLTHERDIAKMNFENHHCDNDGFDDFDEGLGLMGRDPETWTKEDVRLDHSPYTATLGLWGGC